MTAWQPDEHETILGVTIINDVNPEKLMARKKQDPDVPGEYALGFTGGARSLRVELHLGDVNSMRAQGLAIIAFGRQIMETCNTPGLQMPTRVIRLRQAQAECRRECSKHSASQELHRKPGWDADK